MLAVRLEAYSVLPVRLDTDSVLAVAPLTNSVEAVIVLLLATRLFTTTEGKLTVDAVSVETESDALVMVLPKMVKAESVVRVSA